MKYTFRPWHILGFILFIITILAFLTGWECGFSGSCDDRDVKIIQGVFRMVFTISFGILSISVLITLSLLSDYKKEITIRNPFKPNIDPEAEALFKEWLEERKKNKI